MDCPFRSLVFILRKNCGTRWGTQMQGVSCRGRKAEKRAVIIGLDMYLEARKYISGYEFQSDESQQEYRAVCDAIGLESVESTPGLTVVFTAMYWRKANAIHNWFVNNVQGGVDDCRDYYVTEAQLKELISLCREAIDRGDSSLLPSISGCFFGSTEYDEWYWNDLEKTVDGINKALTKFDGCDFYYQSSW